MPITNSSARCWWVGLGGDDRGVVPGRRAGGEAPLPDEVGLELRRVHPLTPGIIDRPGRGAEHAGELAVEVDELLGDGVALG